MSAGIPGMFRLARLCGIAVLTVAGAVRSAHADDAVPVAVKTESAKKGTDADREAAARAFAERHHPELITLLDRLRDRNAGQYQAAIRDLSQSQERLARLEQRGPERYELELELWKIDSRAHLLVARMTMEDRESLQSELRELLTQKRTLKVRLARLERDRLAARLEKIDAELAQESDSAAEIEKEVQRLMKSAHGKKVRRKLPPKPDTKPKAQGGRPSPNGKQRPKPAPPTSDSGKQPPADDDSDGQPAPPPAEVDQ